MSGEMDQAKGKVKEAVGGLTDNKDLENEGKVDKAAGTAKEKVGQAADFVKDKLDGGKA